MGERNPNEVTTFPCARRDWEMKVRTALLFVVFYIILLATIVLAGFCSGYGLEDKKQFGIKIFVQSLFYAALCYFTVRRGNIRRYSVDYQNAIIVDMGGSSEIISSQEVMGAEVLDRKRSFELVKSSTVIGYQGSYKTKEHGTIKAYATNRDCFVLIKTRTVPNYIISPEHPATFATFVNQRLSKG